MEFDKNLLEELAEAAHEILCNSLRAERYKYGPETRQDEKIHSSLRPYAELPEDEKEQNRNNVRDIPNKLASVGYAIVPARSEDAPVEFLDSEVEKLAEMEHERWMQEKLDAGWKYAKTTDKAKKLHQCLVSWDELPQDEKDRDRVLVIGIPRILAKAGYTMVKLG